MKGESVLPFQNQISIHNARSFKKQKEVIRCLPIQSDVC